MKYPVRLNFFDSSQRLFLTVISFIVGIEIIKALILGVFPQISFQSDDGTIWLTIKKMSTDHEAVNCMGRLLAAKHCALTLSKQLPA
jgi:hypothetical protein